jgi:ankyrin repeat protein
MFQEGLTPLHLAARDGHTEVFKVLLAAGANTDIADKVSLLVSGGPSRQGWSRAEGVVATAVIGQWKNDGLRT